MLFFLLNWFGGWYRICGERTDSAAFLDLCMRRRVRYWNFTCDDTCFYLFVGKRTWKKLFDESSREEIGLQLMAEYGLPHLLCRYRGRWGLLVGALLCSTLIFLSGRFVWRVEVRGLEQYRTKDVLEELLAQGFGVGSYIPGVDVNILQNKVLMDSQRFAWLSVNLIGTTARVEVIEYKPKENQAQNTAPMNLVASADGRVVRFSLRNGWESVEVGAVVRKGELLASGVGERKDGGTQLVCADGQVYAEVVHELSVEIPLQYRRKVFETPQNTKKSVIFFGKEIKLFQKTGILGGSCDTIDNERIITFWGRITVPVVFRTQTALPYTYEVALRTPEQALALAEVVLRQQTDELRRERELLTETRTVTVTDTAVQLRCTLSCIEDIAQPEPIILGTPNITS